MPNFHNKIKIIDQLNLDRQNITILNETEDEQIRQQIQQIQPEETINLYYNNKTLKESNYIVQTMILDIILDYSWKYQRFYQILNLQLTEIGFNIQIKYREDILVGNDKLILQSDKYIYMVKTDDIYQLLNNFNLKNKFMKIQQKQIKNDYILLRLCDNITNTTKDTDNNMNNTIFMNAMQNNEFYRLQINNNDIYERFLIKIQNQQTFINFYQFENITKEEAQKYLNSVLLDHNELGQYIIDDILYYQDSQFINCIKIKQLFKINMQIIDQIQCNDIQIMLQQLQSLLKQFNINQNQYIYYQAFMLQKFKFQTIILEQNHRKQLFIKNSDLWFEIFMFQVQLCSFKSFCNLQRIINCQQYKYQQDQQQIQQNKHLQQQLYHQYQQQHSNQLQQIIDLICEQGKQSNKVYIQQQNFQFNLQEVFKYFMNYINHQISIISKEIKEVEFQYLNDEGLLIVNNNVQNSYMNFNSSANINNMANKMNDNQLICIITLQSVSLDKLIDEIQIDQLDNNQQDQYGSQNSVIDSVITIKYQQYQLLNSIPYYLQQICYQILNLLDNKINTYTNKTITKQSNDQYTIQLKKNIYQITQQEIDLIEKIINLESKHFVQLSLQDNTVVIKEDFNTYQQTENLYLKIQQFVQQLQYQDDFDLVNKIIKYLQQTDNNKQQNQYQKLVTEKAFVNICHWVLIPSYIQQSKDDIIVILQLKNNWCIFDFQQIIQNNDNIYAYMNYQLYQQLTNHNTILPIKCIFNSQPLYNELYIHKSIIYGQTIDEIDTCLIDIFKYKIEGVYINCSQFSCEEIVQYIDNIFQILNIILNLQTEKYCITIQNERIVIKIIQ